MTIFQNAIDSIVLGIEDYNSTDPRRAISATRNLVAGILLLIKHKLSTLSPAGSHDVLIKSKVIPKLDGAGGIVWVGSGSKTIDVQQMEERCKELGIAVDWKRLRKIVDHRNEVEHYFSSIGQAALRPLLADSFVLIRDFLRTQLNEDPLTALGASTWTTLTKVADVYAKEKGECVTTIESVDWTHGETRDALADWECPKCGSGLIEVTNPGADKWDAELKCRGCGEEYDFETAAERALKAVFWLENHLSVKDGGDPATVDCPSCGKDAYHLVKNCCLICDDVTRRECEVCGGRIPSSEIDGSDVCGYCRHMMSKDD